MIEHYAAARLAHIAAVAASAGLFLLRALLVQAGRGHWALARLPRYLSYAVDTALLGAGLLLLAMLPSAAFAKGWLAAKLLLLPLYVACGWGALRARSRGRRMACLAGAIAAFAGMAGIARAHDPLGSLARFFGG